MVMMASVSFLNAEDFISKKEDLSKEKVSVEKLNSLEKLKAQEINQVKKSITLYENNPIVQELLMQFLEQIINNSETKYTELLSKYTNELNNSIKNRIGEEVEILRMENTRLQKLLETNQLAAEKTLKNAIAIEVDKIKGIKIELEDKQVANDKQMIALASMFKSIEDKMSSYTKYINTKFSLKAVKEIELSRILLLKEKFPIKYIKNFNNKSQISIVLNNEKEHIVNSMVTDRCRIQNITNTHISIECIDINNKIYKNTMRLEIVEPENDYIINSIQKQLSFSNKKYGVKEGEEDKEEKEEDK